MTTNGSNHEPERMITEKKTTKDLEVKNLEIDIFTGTISEKKVPVDIDSLI
jgi:hypothetical protein